MAVVGAVPSGLPGVSWPQGISTSNMAAITGIAFSCFILIIAQSAATSRSFAMKHGEGVDINRDIVGLSGASFAAGLTGTFVVNGSPTKTQILDEQKGRTQIANLTMSVVVLLFVLFFTTVLTDMPKAVLGAIVFLIGVDLIDVSGLRRIWRKRRSEERSSRLSPRSWSARSASSRASSWRSCCRSSRSSAGSTSRRTSWWASTPRASPTYAAATPGAQSAPGLVVFRYDADLFYANANRFVDDVEALVAAAPEPVRWLVLDAAAIDDVDYSAGVALRGLLNYLDARHVTFALARGDTGLLATLSAYDLKERIPDDRIFGNLADAVDAFRADTRATSS